MHDFNLYSQVARMVGASQPGLTKAAEITTRALYAAAHTALYLLWSDEAESVLGSNMFYPAISMTALFLLIKFSPNGIVNKCACYCTRKMRAIWRRVQTVLRNMAEHHAHISIRRNHLIASAKVLVGTAEILMF